MATLSITEAQRHRDGAPAGWLKFFFVSVRERRRKAAALTSTHCTGAAIKPVVEARSTVGGRTHKLDCLTSLAACYESPPLAL